MSSTALATSQTDQEQATGKLPLPLELTLPVLLATSLEMAVEKAYSMRDTRYNPRTQVREDQNGVPLIINGGSGGTQSEGICGTNIGGEIFSDFDQQRDD